MQAVRTGLTRIRARPTVMTRSLHGKREAEASVTKLVGSTKSAPGGVASTIDTKTEGWRSPAPLFGGPGLLGGNGIASTPQGVIRGFNSIKKSEKCCEHDHDGKHDHANHPGGKKSAILDDDGGFDPSDHPMWNREPIDFLLENNKKWVSKKTQEDPEFFKKLASVHKPEFLFIGCSDARLSVQHMLGLEAGELFVHRNVANMVMHNDLNLLTVLTYAVDYLKVKHIIVCGHYDCGGVRAAMKNHDHGLIQNWITGVKDVARLHREELKKLDDDEAIHRRLVELNVQEQCTKLYANPVMQKSQATTGGPAVHAMVFDVGQGLVKELDIDFKSIVKKYRDVYSMYNFDQKPSQ